MNHKFVFDTNTLISAALLKTSIGTKALNRALYTGRIVISEAVLQEFAEVDFRKKFDKYFLNDNERFYAIKTIEDNSLVYFSQITINACRDPKDNKFLELAVTAGASCIISGDQDLLVLNPFENIPMLSSAEFLERFS